MLIFRAWATCGKIQFKNLLQATRATRGARNPNLQVVIKHVSHVCSQHFRQHSFFLVPRARRFLITWSWNEPSGSGDENGIRWTSTILPLRMNGMHKTQFDHARKRWLSWRLQSRVELAGADPGGGCRGCTPPRMTCGRFLINSVQSLDRHTKSAVSFDIYSQQLTLCYFLVKSPLRRIRF